MNLKSFVLQTHIYLGLFCVPYLLIFSVSSLSFNHVSLEEEFVPLKTETVSIAIDSSDFHNTRQLGEALADSLGLMGWFIPWESRTDTSGFLVNHRHLGRDYRLSGSWGSPVIEMTTNSTRVISRLKGLHGLHEEIPGAPWWINWWGYYQDLTVYSLLFWSLSGVYLWWAGKNRSAGIWLIAGALFSLVLMAYLWLAG